MNIQFHARRDSELQTLNMRGHIDAFFRATTRWRLTATEQRALLGSLADERWFHFMRDVAPAVTPEEFARISAVLQIDKTLSRCITDRHEAAQWFRTLEMASPFFGRTPLTLLFRGIEGFKAVADYLEARRPLRANSIFKLRKNVVS